MYGTNGGIGAPSPGVCGGVWPAAHRIPPPPGPRTQWLGHSTGPTAGTGVGTLH
jgi:hypothetical protein